MRLTIINQFYVPDLSPTAHLAASLAEHRAALGDEVTVVTSRGGYVEASADAASARNANPRIHRIWTPRLGKGSILKRCIDYGTFYLLAVWRVLTLPAQDIIISLTTPPYIAWAGVLHKMLHPRRTKLVLWNMDCYPQIAEQCDKLRRGGVVSRLMHALNRAMFRRLDHLVTLDHAMQDLLMGSYAPRGRQLPAVVIPNWEKASFFPRDAEAQAWDEAAALKLDGRLVVLYLGNMGYGHQFETVIQAAQTLRDEPVTFLFVGGGSQAQVIARAKQEQGLNGLILHDYVPKEQTPSVMTTASCALITMRDDALGLVSPSKLHSNLAMGLPVIYVGPRGSNVDEALERFGCGVSLRHGDSAGMSAFVREVMARPERLNELGRRARQAFDQAYCDTRTLAQFDQVIDSLARGVERRDGLPKAASP